jgi:hypothetical protein
MIILFALLAACWRCARLKLFAQGGEAHLWRHMATFESVLSTRSPLERREVEARLYLLSSLRATTYQSYSSLKAESRLPDTAWSELIELLLRVSSEPVEIQKVVRAFCRSWTLAGHEIPSLRSKIFGRAVSEKWLIALVRKSLRGKPGSSALKEVRDLYTKPFPLVKDRWSSRDLGNHLMWSTFDTHGDSPFRRFPKTANGIRRLLGLDPNFSGEPLLLFEYTLHVGAMPRFPTIADAYAGDEWSYFFTPAPESAPHGMTMAWPDYAGRSKPRPEVVHEVIRGVQLMVQPRKVP